MELNHDLTAARPWALRRRWGHLLSRLVRTTHFDWEELESLCFVFHKLTKGTQGRMPRKVFVELMHAALDLTGRPQEFAVTNFDPTNTTFIDMEAWCRGLSILLRGSLDDQIKYCFRTLDLRNEGVLKLNNLKWMARQLQLYSEQDKELVEITLSCFKDDPKNVGESPGTVSYKEFHDAVHRSPLLLSVMGELLPTRDARQAFLTSFCPKVLAAR